MTTPSTTAGGTRRGPVSWRVAVWLFHLALPLLGLWLLIARPRFDVRWEHHGAHFWLVLAAGAVSVGVGAVVAREAGQRADARLVLVAAAFLSAAGFLALHALATPGVILDSPNAGFVVATPAGLTLAGVFALASSLPLDGPVATTLVRRRAVLWAALAVVLVAWAAVSLSDSGPLSSSLLPTEAHGPLLVVAIVGSVLYGVAAVRYLILHRRRPSPVLLSVLTAFALLAEALVAAAYARNWQASWWEWHLLMTAAFALVAYAARVQYEREGTTEGLFGSLALEQTVRQVREEYESALEALVTAMRAGAEDGARPALGPVLGRLAARFSLTDRQVAVLERSAEALAAERDLAARLGALVEVGNEASVIRPEDELLARVAALVDGSFGTDRLRLGVLHDGRLTYRDGDGAGAVPADLRAAALERLEPAEAPGGELLVLPLVVKGHAAGVIEVRPSTPPVADRDRAVLRSFASQVSIALENARLYSQLDGLFRSYMSPDVATALLADPDQAALGGTVTEVTLLMADLQGFTTFSERTAPEEVVAMLNVYWGVAVPAILGEGGTVMQFIGDAVIALFGAPVRQPDHALRAVRAGLALQSEAVRVGQPGWPRFRVGINTGPALVGNVGSAQFRNFTAIGDTVNLAARLESAAEAGSVVVGERTRALLDDRGEVAPLGSLTLKGKSEPVAAFTLLGLRD